MESVQQRPAIVNGLIAAALALLLGSSLVATPQTLSWLCAWDCLGLGMQIMPPVEEEVEVETGRIAERVSASLPEPASLLVFERPHPSDDTGLPGSLARVAVPPPEAC